jgi:hypothetical protein
MLTAIALPLSTFPLPLVEQHRLAERTHDRGGERELQFHFRGLDACLPVWHAGRLRIVRWGCRRSQSRVLPCTGWTKRATVEAGRWANWNAEPAEVPAALGMDNGFWYAIEKGIRALLVCDEHGTERVYIICEPSSHYYQVMTRSTWMPVMTGEHI